MFSSCPFRSLLENVQDLWFWVKIEKVMKENMRRKQNKRPQNIEKEDECSAPYVSLRSDTSSLWNPLGSLWGLLGLLVSCINYLQSPNGLLWRHMAPLWSSHGSLRAWYGPLWTLMGPFKPLIHSFGPYIGLLYWQSGFLWPHGQSVFPMTHFGTIEDPYSSIQFHKLQ